MALRGTYSFLNLFAQKWPNSGQDDVEYPRFVNQVDSVEADRKRVSNQVGHFFRLARSEMASLVETEIVHVDDGDDAFILRFRFRHQPLQAKYVATENLV